MDHAQRTKKAVEWLEANWESISYADPNDPRFARFEGLMEKKEVESLTTEESAEMPAAWEVYKKACSPQG